MRPGECASREQLRLKLCRCSAKIADGITKTGDLEERRRETLPEHGGRFCKIDDMRMAFGHTADHWGAFI